MIGNIIAVALNKRKGVSLNPFGKERLFRDLRAFQASSYTALWVADTLLSEPQERNNASKDFVSPLLGASFEGLFHPGWRTKS